MAERRHAAEAAQATEFASKSFHDKIDQHHSAAPNQQQQQQQQQQSQTQTEAGPLPFPSGSRFSLPLRGESKSEHDKKEKKGFFKLRSKVSFLHSKPTPALAPVVEPLPVSLPLRPSTESAARKTLPLDSLFSTLPNELQIQVLEELSVSDVLNLRLSSKTWHSLLTAHERNIVKHQLERYIPDYARNLFPIMKEADYNFHHICGLWHRLHVAAKLAYMISDYVARDIFLRTTDNEWIAFGRQRETMRCRLIPRIFTAFHFFEMYRKLHLQYIAEHGHGLKMDPYTVNPIEKQIMEMYDDETLLRVHEVFPLIISSFCRRLRPPTYVGRIEKSLRGYLREKPSDDLHTAILMIGGMRQVERLWEIKGYNSRRAAVDKWFNSIGGELPSESAHHKSRRSLMSFGRKKSTGGEPREGHRERKRSSFSSLHRTRSPSGSIDAGNENVFDSNWIFHTSMSDGIPMGSLSRDQAQNILNDLPVLQQIWMTTAEAMILDRRVVQSPRDIKRNQHMMLDLIKEDNREWFENPRDEWSYGRKLPDSVRPPDNAVPEGDLD